MSAMAARYELMLTLPADVRYAVTARAVAVAAACHSGCGEDAADTFGRNVERTVHRCLSAVAPDGALPITIRCAGGPVEVLVDGHTIAVQA